MNLGDTYKAKPPEVKAAVGTKEKRAKRAASAAALEVEEDGRKRGR